MTRRPGMPLLKWQLGWECASQAWRYSPRFFQTLLRMDLVTVGALPDSQGTLLPTPAAITDETERLARKAGYRFKLIPPAPFAPPRWTLWGGA